jgi:hypothetical protein
MGAYRRIVLPAWIGALLIAVGCLLLAGSYFFLPLYATTMNCFDSCTPPKYATAWEFSQNVLLRFSITPPVSASILVLLWLPLLAAVIVLGCSAGFLMYPRRAFASGIRISRLTGGIALITSLVLYLVLLFGWIRPDFGYLGMLFGYGLLWGGTRLVLSSSH